MTSSSSSYTSTGSVIQRAIRIVVLVCSLLPALNGYAQQTTGSSGLLNIPSGDIYPDKTMSIGMNYLPKGQAGRYFDYNTANYFFNLSFLPFIEGTYRLTLFKVDSRYTQQDRAFGAKCRLWKEGKIVPSLLVGMDDIYTHTAGNQYFASSYLASSKTLSLNEHAIRFTLGYGFNPRDRNRLKGWFGGIDYRPKNLRSLSLMAEYDSWKINVAGSLLLWKHVSVYAGTYGFEQLAAGVCYRFLL